MGVKQAGSSPTSRPGRFWRSACYSLVLIATALTTSCRSDVDSGRNADPPSPESNGNDGSAGDGDGTGLNPAPGEDGGDGEPLRCFGPSPERIEPTETFCTQVAPDYATDHAKVIDHLCQRLVLTNLFRDGCAWQGNGEPNPHLRFIEATPLDASGSEFYFFRASSQDVTLTVDEAMARTRLAYTDNDTFRERFIMPEGTAILNSVPSGDAVEYTATAMTAVAELSFRGRMEFVKVNDGLGVVFEKGISDFVTVKDLRSVTFLMKLTDTRTRIVRFGETRLDDRGLHSTARSAALKGEKEKMEIIHENSTR